MEIPMIRPLSSGDGESFPALGKLLSQLTSNILEPNRFKSRLASLMLQSRSYWQAAFTLRGQPVAFSGIVLLDNKRAVIEEVVVHQDYRRRGLGARMTKLLLDWASDRSVQEVRLITANPAAERVYKKLGFSVVKAGDDPAKVMVKRFPGATGRDVPNYIVLEEGIDHYAIPSKGWVGSSLWPDNTPIFNKLQIADQRALRQLKVLAPDSNFAKIYKEAGFALNPPKPGHGFEKVMALAL